MALKPKSGSYSGDPVPGSKDEVRFFLGDTDEPFDLSDAEINRFIATFGNTTTAAAELSEALYSRFSCLVDKSIGSLKISLSQKADRYEKRAKQLREALVRNGLVEVFVGGLSKSAKRALLDDDDAVQPHTQVGEDDYPGNGDSASGPFYWGYDL